MAACEKEIEENNREVFWGDLERRRPTKRWTTRRPIGIVRNWAEQNAPELKRSSRKNGLSLQSKPITLQSRHISSRTEPSKISPSSSQQLHQPLSSQDVHSLSTEDGLDTSPQQGPAICQSGLEFSLVPGGAEVTPLKTFHSKKSTESLPETYRDNEEDEMVLIEKQTPEQNVATPQTGLKSGPQLNKKKKALERKVVAFHIDGKEDKDDGVDEKEYEAQNFVRLFNADRGRKRSVTDITDLDIILTNVEEIALELKNDEYPPLCKKVMREAFIQLRQIFSDSIDVYKEKKYLKSATTKTNSKVKKIKQELVKVQAKRSRTRTKLEKLQSEYEKLERQRKGKEEANCFLTEFENLQDRLRKSKVDHGQKEHCLNEDLPSLLSEACGYLSTHRQLKNINDKLEQWLDKNTNPD